MSKTSEIEAMLKEAMRARDSDRVATLRLVLSALRLGEKDKLRELSEDEEIEILQRERKQRVEAMEAFASAGRDDQATAESAELAIIEQLMPPRLEEDELMTIIDRAIATSGATSPADLGRVMSAVMPEVAGRADGSRISQIVREKLS